MNANVTRRGLLTNLQLESLQGRMQNGQRCDNF